MYIVSLIPELHKDAVSSTDCIYRQIVGCLMNSELDKTWKEAVLA